jgi:hypothetical protein
MILMGLEGARMLYVTLQKQGPYWCKRTTQDENDTIGEGITIGLILFLGIISIINSIGIVVYSVALVVNKQLVLMELLRTLIVAGLLLAIGLASLYFFRKEATHVDEEEEPVGTMKRTHAWLNIFTSLCRACMQEVDVEDLRGIHKYLKMRISEF